MLAQRLRQVAVTAANHFGLHITRTRASRWGLENYPDPRRPDNPKYVNIGAGGFRHPLWHNLDAPNEFYAGLCRSVDLAHDLKSIEPLPFADGSIDIFYCSHVIEHLDPAEVERLFAECFRCLRPGGRLRISCPDMEILYRAYRAGDGTLWARPSPWGTSFQDHERRFVEYFATGSKLASTEIRQKFEALPMAEFFDAVLAAPRTRMGTEAHCNWFTVDKLIGLLGAAGFDAERSSYLQSPDPRLRDPRLFDATCPELSLYVEARR